MKIAKLTAVAVAGVLTFAACKYEDGPAISLRSKRDRVANEWKIVKYEFEGKDALEKVNQSFDTTSTKTPFMLVINFARTGGYGVEVVKKYKDGNGNEKYITNASESNGKGFNACCSTQYNAYLDSLPSHFRYIMPNGTWTFDRGHTKIQVKPELSFDNDKSLVMTQKNTIDWGITLLKQKEMKVKGRDEMNREWKLHLKPMNSEPYWY